MSVEEIIKDYQKLSEQDRRLVIDFVDNLPATQKSSPAELGILARELVECEDDDLKTLLSEKITRAFYGTEEDDPLPPAA